MNFVKMILENGVYIFMGFLYCFFWVMAFALAKDLARKDYGYVRSVLFSVGFIVGVSLLTLFCSSFILGAGFASLGFLAMLLEVLNYGANPWIVIGLLGFVLSACLGAHFGVLMFYDDDKF